ncbi:hypothetical protein IG631_01492 [Alternaria alternata]|nr:hypothetical protein IG631_01492 [Alternaria alternata]
MTAKPRRHKRSCWAPLWEHVRMMIRPKASPEDLDFACAGLPCSTAFDHTVLRIPTASLDLGTKDNCSGLSTIQLISSIPSPARQKSIDPQYPEDASKEDNTSSGNEPACDSHPLHRNKELKAFPNVTTNCGLGLTKYNQVNGIIKTSHFIVGSEVPEVFEEEREDVQFCVADDGSVELIRINANMA